MKGHIRIRACIKPATESDISGDITERSRRSDTNTRRKQIRRSTSYALSIRAKDSCLDISHLQSGRRVRIQSSLSKGSMGISIAGRVQRSASRSMGKGSVLLKVTTLSFTSDPELTWMNNYTKGIYVTDDVTCDDLRSKMTHNLLRGTPKEKAEAVRDLCVACSLFACDTSASPRLLSASEKPLTLLQTTPSLHFVFAQKCLPNDTLPTDPSVPSDADGIMCHGLLGVVPLLSCSFLVIAREVSSIGRLPVIPHGSCDAQGPEVFFIDEIDLIPIPPQTPLAPDLVCGL